MLGIMFTSFQAFEYSHAAFSFRRGIYSVDLLHGDRLPRLPRDRRHDLPDGLLLARRRGDFTPERHFGFEAAAWYWHFVDVVWLFLFICVYWWGAGEIAHHDGCTRRRPRWPGDCALMTEIVPPPWWRAALACRCPRCGEGEVCIDGLLKVRPACAVCGLDLSANDTGDGPASLVILVLGAVVVALAFWVEFRFEPPLWVHVLLWPVLTLAGALALMRPLKAALVALQFRHRASEMGL